MAVTDIDQRAEVSGLFPVAVKTLELVLDYSEDDDMIEEDIEINGETKQIHFIIPDLEGSHTAQLILHDEDDNILYASDELAENTSHVLAATVALAGTITVRIETSAAEIADQTFTVTIYYV